MPRMPRPPELRAFYEGFEAQHHRIVETLRPLTREQVQLRAAPTEWAIWQLAANMCGGRLYWLCFMLREDDLGIGMEQWSGWEDTPDHPRTPSELVANFEATWKVAEHCMDRWSLADLNVDVTRNNWWGNPVTISPAWVLWRLMSHEAHHGSEIALILRIHGLPTQIAG